MRKLDFMLMVLVITTTVLNSFIRTGYLILVSYSLMLCWGVWRYKNEGSQAYIWVSILSLVTIILSIL